ncbi:MAG TPA: 16S rRNA (cytosine(1402)-N(4))-methyltransferase, partial [Gemmatimonadales bacterium]|nr:16S rRNA (cytosine(1402)-N(4))-methyltransferase [Gemmatimonadales bacterium]
MSTTLLDPAAGHGPERLAPDLGRRRRAGQSGGPGRRAGRARPNGAAGDLRPANTPVLAGELLELLGPRPGQTAIDCTFGDGGHARLLAERLGPNGTLVAIDRDPL